VIETGISMVVFLYMVLTVILFCGDFFDMVSAGQHDDFLAYKYDVTVVMSNGQRYSTYVYCADKGVAAIILLKSAKMIDKKRKCIRMEIDNSVVEVKMSFVVAFEVECTET